MAPELQLKRVRIRNWATIKDAQVEFPESGLVLVRGNNAISAGHLDGVGAGKTNFGSAISRALIGVPDRPIGKYSRNKAGDTYVRVDASIRGKSLVSEIGLKCKELSRTGEGVRFCLEGQDPVSRSHVGLTKDELTKVIGLTPGLAKWTTWIDGEKLRFNDLSQKEAIELLMAALHQPSWTAIHKKSSVVLDYFESERDSTSTLLTSASSKIASIESTVNTSRDALQRAKAKRQDDIDKAQQKIDAAEEQLRQLQEDLENVNSESKSIKAEIKDIEKTYAEEYAALESARLEIDGLLKLQVRATCAVEAEYTARTNERISHSNALKKPKECPTCKRGWPQSEENVSKARELSRQSVEAEASAKSIFEAEKLKERELQQKLDEFDLRIRSQQVKVKVNALSQRHSKLESSGESLCTRITAKIVEIERLRAPVDNSGVVEAETRLQISEASLASYKAEVERLSKELADINSSLSVVKYWTTSFGPTGIPNMVLRDAVEPLNDIARRISQILCGGMISVKFTAEKELASGGEKDELVVQVENVLGSGDLESCSKGERGLSNLIIAETLSELSCTHNTCGFCWYDEVTTNLPQSVRATLFQFFREKAERNGQLIFVVDHGTEIANYAHHILVVEKTGEGSAVTWQR